MFVKNIKALGGFRSEYYWLTEKNCLVVQDLA